MKPPARVPLAVRGLPVTAALILSTKQTKAGHQHGELTSMCLTFLVH